MHQNPRQSSADLQAHIARLQAYLDAVSSGIFVYDASGRLVDVNETACRMHGYALDEMLTRDPRELIHPDHHHVFEAFTRAVMAGEAFRGEEKGVRRDGSLFDAEVEGRLIEIDGEQYLFSSIIDVTERNRLAEQLRHSQRLEVTGQLAGGIAHEFNNLLMVMIGSAEIVQRGEADPTLSGEVRSLLDAGEQARQLIEHLMAFSRQQLLKIEEVDICELAEKQVELLRRLLPSTIELVFRSACSRCLVKADRSQLQHILLNLCINARQAMPRGGRLEIVIAQRAVASRQETAALLVPGTYCLLEVRDTGEGMEAATLSRAFEPFFTTRNASGASGLGLSMVYGSVRQHGGDVAIESTPEQGTVVQLLLPLAATETRRAGPQPQDGGRTTDARVLVVEDNAGVRTLVERMLDGLGYVVATAASSAEAEAAARQTPPDVALLDMVLPDGSGVEVLGRLRERQPQLPAVFMTGYVDADTLGLADGLADVPMLRKPFQLDTLAAALRKVLSAASA